MTSKQLLLALGELDDHTIAAAHEPMRKVIRRPLRAALIAAAVVALCLTVAWAAVSHYHTYVLKTDQAVSDLGLEPGVCRVGLVDLDDELESSNLYARRTGDSEAALWSDQARISTEMTEYSKAGHKTGVSATFHTVTPSGQIEPTGISSDWDVTYDGGGMPSLSAMKQNENLIHPDVSYLESSLTPVEGSFLYMFSRGSGVLRQADGSEQLQPEQLVELDVAGCYRTPSGGALGIWFDYMPALGNCYIIYKGDSITRHEEVKSADGTPFDIIQFGQFHWAIANFSHGMVWLDCVDCTWDEVVEQITHLDLGDVPAVFSTGN